tara:strand:- start:450 stop:620 length:171 start_codon:yes stop_codon:yes gene_type:complete
MTTNTEKLEEKLNSMTARISTLRDDMVSMQTEFTSIVKKIENDMRKVVTEVKRQKG